MVIRELASGSVPHRGTSPFIRQRNDANADESGSWDALHAQYEMKRINHEEAYSLDGACTNWPEEFFGLMRRPAIFAPIRKRPHGVKTIAGSAKGEQVYMDSGLAMKRGPSVDFCSYWQRGKAAKFVERAGIELRSSYISLNASPKSDLKIIYWPK